MYASARETLEYLCVTYPDAPRESAILHGVKGGASGVVGGLLALGTIDAPSGFQLLLGGLGACFGVYAAYHLTLSGLYTVKWLNTPQPSTTYFMTEGRFTNRPTLVDRVYGERVTPVDERTENSTGLVVMNGLTVQEFLRRRILPHDYGHGVATRRESLELIANWQGNPLLLDVDVKNRIHATVLEEAFYIVARPNGKSLSVLLYGDAVA